MKSSPLRQCSIKVQIDNLIFLIAKCFQVSFCQKVLNHLMPLTVVKNMILYNYQLTKSIQCDTHKSTEMEPMYPTYGSVVEVEVYKQAHMGEMSHKGH